jgi:creatinine amidohydrolase
MRRPLLPSLVGLLASTLRELAPAPAGRLSAHWEELTAAYRRGFRLQLLQVSTDEMARNGCRKVIIVNGRSGNARMLSYFAQTQLESPRDHVVFVQGFARSGPGEPKHRSNPATDMHAGESETS